RPAFLERGWPVAQGCFRQRWHDGECGRAPAAYMNPGLRGRYRVQSPKSRVDASTIGNAIRIPRPTAAPRMAWAEPGMNAETCGALLSAATPSAVRKAASAAAGLITASGPMWPVGPM